MDSPEDIESLSSYAPVNLVIGLSCSERRVLSHHLKKNDSCGEDIDHLSVIRLVLMNLRCHIIHAPHFL